MPKKKIFEEEKPEEMPLPDENTVICVVERLFGGEHLLVRCVDGNARTARIPGKFRKKVWIKEGDVVLVAPWDTQPEKKGDVVYKYSSSEVKRLADMGLLPPELVERSE